MRPDFLPGDGTLAAIRAEHEIDREKRRVDAARVNPFTFDRVEFLLVEYDRRVAELLVANNREVERRREAEEEVAYWRTEMLAKLQMATWLHNGLIQKGDENRAADVRVSTIMPTLAALKAAAVRDFYESCPLCGNEIRPGMRVVQVAIGDPDDSSMACAEHDEPERSYVYEHDLPEAIMAAAEATLADPADGSIGMVAQAEGSGDGS